MARTNKRGERVEGRNVNLHPSTWEALRRRAFEERTTISEQARRALEAYLAQGPRGRVKKGGGVMRAAIWVGCNLWIAVLALVVGIVTPALALDIPGERESLAGLAGFDVLVEAMDHEVEREGLARSTLQTDVEVKVRQAGIRVLTSTEGRVAPGSPYLYLRVTAVRFGEEWPLYAAGILLELKQQVLLARKPTIALFATTWRTSWVGAAGAYKIDWVRERVRDRVDEFINAYLAANPKR